MADITILDGGMGKELRRIGAPFRQPEWSALALMEAPETVVQAHTNFIDAGAQVVTTSNYAVVPFHLGDDRFDRLGIELTSLAGRLAREAVTASERSVLIAGSLPPLFGSYEPDSFDAERAAPIYCDIVRSLTPHVDLWIAETLSSIAEMNTIVAALADAGNTAPIWVAFAVPNSFATGVPALRSGETIGEVADAIGALDRSVDAALINCSLPEQTGQAIRELRSALDQRELTHVRTGGYANAFPDETASGYRANQMIFERRTELTGERYADMVAEWVADDATIVGGCCDMYPEHIAAIAERLG